MNKTIPLNHSLRRFARLAALLAVSLPSLASAQGYIRTNLVSDGVAPAPHVDPNLVNPWGMAFSSTSKIWIANQRTGTSTIHAGSGEPDALVVKVPGKPFGTPTGIVFSGGSGFRVGQLPASAPSRFLFAGLDGTISGWSPGVNLTEAILAVDRSGSGASYTGLAISGGANLPDRLFAANFGDGVLEVYNGDFQLINKVTDPALPPGVVPFGAETIGGLTFVTFVEPVRPGLPSPQGNGFVSVFDSDGNHVRRFASRGTLNLPWGLALAPASFGKLGGMLLVGNLADGRIQAFDPASGKFEGFVEGVNGKPVEIDGLWALKFGNGAHGASPNRLFFTSGPEFGNHGVFGTLEPVPELGSIAALAAGFASVLGRRLRRKRA